MTIYKKTTRKVCPACEGRGKEYGVRMCRLCKGRHWVEETEIIEEIE